MDIKKKIKDRGIDLVYIDSEKKGYYLDNTIFINQNLPEQEIEQILAHELYHALNHEGLEVFYNNSYSARSKIECDANRNMIKESLVKYVADCESDDIDTFNWLRFASWAGFNLTDTTEWLIKDEMAKYFTN